MIGDSQWLSKQILRWNKFASLESLYSACRPLCKHEVATFELRAADFGCFLPRTFPSENLNPKFHMLVIEMPRYMNLMASSGISMGMGNEQSIETIHVKFNKEVLRMRNAKSKGEKLRRSMAQLAEKHDPHTKSVAARPVKRPRYN